MSCTINDFDTGPNIAWSSQKCSDTINTLIDQKCIPKVRSFTAGNLAQFNVDGSLVDSFLKIDDKNIGPNVIWTSKKIESEMKNKFNKCVLKVDYFTPDNLIIYDQNGELKSSSMKVDDEALPSSEILYSSKKLDNLIKDKTNNFIPKLEDPKDGYLISSKVDGTLSQTPFYISDISTSDKNVWSSSKTKTFLNKLVNDNFGSQLKKTNDAVTKTNTEVLKLTEIFDSKVDKITNGVPNNFLQFDDKGQIVDSGLKIDDNSTSPFSFWSSEKVRNVLAQNIEKVSEDIKHCALKPFSSTPNNIPKFNEKGDIEDSGFSINDDDIGQKILWSSQKQKDTWNMEKMEIMEKIDKTDLNIDLIKSTKMEKLDLKPNTLIQTNEYGKLINSKYVVDDSAPPDDNIIWTSKKWDFEKVARFNDSKIVPNNLLAFDANLQIGDSGVRVDNNCETGQCLWTADKIKNELQISKFHISGILQPNFTIKSDKFYNPEFTVLESSNADLIGKTLKDLKILKSAFYYQNINGVVVNSNNELVYVEMKFKSKNILNYGKNFFNLSFSSVDKYTQNDNFVFEIRTLYENTDITTSKEYPLRFQVFEV